MPNTPCLIGECASAFVTGNNCNNDDFDKTYSLMSAVGKTSSCTHLPGRSIAESPGSFKSFPACPSFCSILMLVMGKNTCSSKKNCENI